MTEPVRHGLLSRQQLTEDEIAATRELAEICNTAESLDLDLGFDYLSAIADDQAKAFLHYREGILVGFIGLYNYGGPELELTGMVHPAWRRQGIFRSLLEAAKGEARRRNTTRLLLMTQRDPEPCQAFAAVAGAQYRFSEHKMEWEGPMQMPPLEALLRLEQATVGEAELLVSLYIRCFGDPEEEVRPHVETILRDPQRHVHIARLHTEPIGVITVVSSDMEAYIAGFGVLPELRGKGYGRQILATTVDRIVTSGQRRIVLEVTTDNRAALGLYRSCGFQESTAYDYYELALG